MKIIHFIFFILIFSITNIPFLRSQQLTQDEFEEHLAEAYRLSNNQLVKSLIGDHRLMVKPFVNRLIRESILLELNGNIIEAQQKQSLVEKTASTFKNIHGEKSLVIAVNYLSLWSKEQKEKKVLADSLFALGTSIRGNRQQHEKAIEYYQQALEIYTEIGDERGEAEILGGLGFIQWYRIIWFQEDPQKALSYFQEALEIRNKIDDQQLIGNSLNDIGSINLRYIRDYSKAVSFYKKAELVRREIEDIAGLGSTITYMASAYEKLGQFEQALEYYKSSFDVNQELGNKKRMAEAMRMSGTILTDMGNYPKAIEHFEKALEIYNNLNERLFVGDVLKEIGFVYSKLGDFKTAIEKYTEVVQIMKEENDLSGLAGAYNNIGITLQSSGRIEKASEYYKRSLDIYEEQGDQYGVLTLLNNLGTLYYDMKDYAKAEEYHYRGFQISRELQTKLVEVHCLLNMANDQNRLGKLDEAMVNYQTGFDKATSLNSPDLIWRILVGIGENYALRNEYDKAIEYNDRALSIIEKMRGMMQSDEFKAGYMAVERYAFEGAINLLGKLHEKDGTKGYDLQAFHYAERSKARAFLDLLAESIANVREGADQKLLEKQEEILTSLTQTKQQLEQESLKNQVNADVVTELKGQIDTLEEKFNALQKEIRSTNPKYADLQYPQPASLKEVQSSCLDRNTAFLEYSLGDSCSYLWVITREDHQLFKLPDRKTLQEQIETLRFALLNPKQSNIGFFTQSSFSLYRQLIQPAEQFFSKKSKLVIIPDGTLNYLPFEVLITEEQQKNTEGSYSDLLYLVKKYPISYGQSSSVLKSLITEQKRAGASGKSSKKLIAFGDPVYENEDNGSFIIREGFGRLEHSGIEVEKIATLFQEGFADIYLMNEATEENVKKEGELAKFSYIHFATHGLIDERKPDYSSLVLTQEENSVEDGLLQTAEIFNLNMDADLVVLSACQTGLGKMVRGEGMVGLTRAFMYAGTPSVLVSLWNVADISTAGLMEKFYENLIKKELTKTDALRRAQLSMIKDEQFAHPFYWAPFVLIGDWQ